jgi:hypothetical protein
MSQACGRTETLHESTPFARGRSLKPRYGGAMLSPLAISWPLTVVLGVAVILVLAWPVMALGRWMQRKGRDIERGKRDG